MRILWLGLLLVVSLGAADAPKETARQREFVIGLSPFLDKSVKDEVYRGIVLLLVEDLPLNSTLRIYDAYQLKSIAEITLPDIRAFSSPKTRANQFSGAVQNLKHFLAQEHAKPTREHLNFDGAIRLPQFCDFLNEIHPPIQRPLQVLLIGSPLYQDAKEPAFSMVDGYFPSDGHLLATREKSVFGTRVLTNSNPGLEMTVHWAYFGDPWITDLHREKITRFWSLFLEKRDCQLQTFCGDLHIALNAFQQVQTGSGAFFKRWTLDPEQTKIEMLRIGRNVELTDWITRDALPQTAVPPPSTMVGPLKIGIRWQSKIDLDLYATPRKGGETLYFEHPRSPDGSYYKDHRSSPGREYEFVEFEVPIDLREVESSINFYQGSCAGGPRGEVRIEFDGRIYSGTFSIAASRGNQGRTGGRQSEYWTRIPIQEILKITPSSRLAGKIGQE